MREFNIFGPVNPTKHYHTKHYHVNCVAVKEQIKQKIEKGRYLCVLC